jgi:magnesium transporter
VQAFAFERSLMTGRTQQTRITRPLAAWVAILAAPTAATGIHGMNFEHVPELKWTYGCNRHNSRFVILNLRFPKAG